MVHSFLVNSPTSHFREFVSTAQQHNRVQPFHFDLSHALLSEEAELPRSLPPIFSALEALEKCPILREVLPAFPPHLHVALKASLLVPDPYRNQRLHVLEELLFGLNEIRDIVDEAKPVPLPLLLHHECVFILIEGMLLETKKYRRELSFLFTQLPVSRLPMHLQKRVSTLKMHSSTVIPSYSEWSLCSSAESRLTQAMDDLAVLLVNGTLLLKFNGKLSGLALQTTLLADGTQLLEECWYAPIDRRDEIRDAYDCGESRLTVDVQWAFIRALDAKDDDVLEKARKYVAMLPEQLPQQTNTYYTSRKTYRSDMHEGF